MGTVLGPSSMLDRLLTSRPIRIEDGRDVGGRRKEGRAEREDATGSRNQTINHYNADQQESQNREGHQIEKVLRDHAKGGKALYKMQDMI
ncbi:hypothetical protein NDU88_008008 [Pleurodeles waltl]|uniref:Uncharacterized protein n=1 Tax=Pleurodeles waltl TaxID=8319 RepID=A0AAV7ND15_PLEWA|nr:hypothetical protein NDU88_008008 [Pleurodeles waltl]